ncbi:hypothetical protein [Spirillospora sp. CA-294931]|uniref:hypothetical protein n=1 Tax=Spirillospora sp. CA-294931 TaxID=3240042 RepID=UPI003D942A7C
MTESGAGAAAPMSREGVDHALLGLREKQEKISGSLLELDAHDGYRLLQGARLTGETRNRWDETKSLIALMWQLYDSFRSVLDEAMELRGRHSRPDHATLERLTAILTGTPVGLPTGDVPIQERTLLGSAKEWVSLEEAVDLMSAAFGPAAELVGAADAAWTVLLVPLEEAEERWRDTARLVRSLGGGRRADLDRLGRELTALGQIARADPLALVRDGTPDTSRLDRLMESLSALHDRLSGAAAIRDSYGERVEGIAIAVADVEEAERQAREAREEALIKIVSPGLPEPPSLAPGLRRRLISLDALREQGRWDDLVERTEQLDRDVGEALDGAREAARLCTGLLDRRNELRGRLQAYQAKAGRLGLAEDETLTDLYAQARDLLWTAPCDLRRATAAVAAYQRAIKMDDKAGL